MRREGLLAWLLVFAALAAPGGSVYLWLDGTVNASRRLETPRRLQKKVPLFAAPHKRAKLVNPAQGPVFRAHEEDAPVAEVLAAAEARPTVVSSKPQLPSGVLLEAAKPVAAPQAEPEIVKTEPAPAPVVYTPRRRVVREKPIQDTINVEAIIALNGLSSAIVNGLAVKEGDMVGKVKVVLITSERVTFAYKNLRFMKSI